jgi:hypothetical protein
VKKLSNDFNIPETTNHKKHTAYPTKNAWLIQYCEQENKEVCSRHQCCFYLFRRILETNQDCGINEKLSQQFMNR